MNTALADAPRRFE